MKSSHMKLCVPTFRVATSNSAARGGLTLLEVILALAILAISMAAIGEIVRTGARSARRAKEMTRAQILCESKLSELVAGAEPYEPVVRAPLLTDPDWYYTVELTPTLDEGVIELAVTVETNIERPRPLAFTLIRWVPDPGLELPDEPVEGEADGSEDASLQSDVTGGGESGAAGFGG